MPFKIKQDGSLEGDDSSSEKYLPLRSEEVSQIMSFKPSFLIRYGTACFLIILLLVVVICSFVRYPDTIKSYAVIKAYTEPIPLTVQGGSFKLIQLLSTNNQNINRGDTVAFLQSISNSQIQPIISPVKGILSLQFPIEQSQILTTGQILGYILNQKEDYYAEMFIPQNSLAKVKIGVEVTLALNAYPSSEYGNLIGNIIYISPIPKDNKYIATILLQKGLITDSGKSLKYYSGLQAEAKIVILDQTLFHKVFGNTFQQPFQTN